MAGYEYQVFVSYRRAYDWEPWVRKLFVPKLRSFLSQHFADPISVFSDEQIVTGAAWRKSIHDAIDSSCIMVPVFFGAYFGSEWCRLELARMLHREKKIGFRSQRCNDTLILPVCIGSRQAFPDLVSAIQYEDLYQFAIPHMGEDTKLHQEFDVAMQRFCKKIADALQRIPPHDPSWSKLDGGIYLPKLAPKPFHVTINPRLAA